MVHENKSRQPVRGEYHPHIDGLRCLAVIPVVIYHMFMGLCPGGFMGVDVFFAVSGYLICGGILRDLQAGRFSMTQFYVRRIRRIFPAYFVLVLCVLAAGVALYHWARILPLAQTTLFSALFSTNLYFWLDMGYFQPNAHGNPLLHLWSLGVEEQFYILIPLALLVLWRLWRKGVVPLLVAAAAVSLLLCVGLGQLGQSTTAFYILPARGWELLAGALLATRARAKDSAASRGLAAVGIVLLALAYGCVSTRKTFGEGGTSVEVILPFLGSLGITPFPGWVAVPAIAGSLLLLHYGNFGPVGRLLTAAPCVGIGKISYSLYLWHWPIIVFADYLTFGQAHSPVAACVTLGLCFATAFASWRWVELPVRLSPTFTARRAFTMVAVGCSLLLGLSILLIHTDGLREILHTQANVFAYRPRPFLNNFEKFQPKPEFAPPPYPGIDPHHTVALGRPGVPPSFCLLGDSHAESLAPGLDEVAAGRGLGGLYLTSRVMPQIHVGDTTRAQRMLEWVARHPDIREVYFVGRWMHPYRLPDTIPPLGGSTNVQPARLSQADSARLEAELRETARWFATHGKRVTVFSCVPEYGYNPTDIAARRAIIPTNARVALTRKDYENRQGPVARIFEKLEAEGLIRYVRLHETLFDGDSSVYMGPAGTPFYSDDNHLTPAGARHAVEALAPVLWGNPAPAAPSSNPSAAH